LAFCVGGWLGYIRRNDTKLAGGSAVATAAQFAIASAAALIVADGLRLKVKGWCGIVQAND
jgi:hypothetical protein